MKSLIPSHRENKRYLLLEGKNLKTNAIKAIQEFIGTFGMSQASPKFVSTDTKVTILSINRESLDKVRASFCVYPEKIEVKKVSGSIKGLTKIFKQ